MHQLNSLEARILRQQRLEKQGVLTEATDALRKIIETTKAEMRRAAEQATAGSKTPGRRHKSRKAPAL